MKSLGGGINKRWRKTVMKERTKALNITNTVHKLKEKKTGLERINYINLFLLLIQGHFYVKGF